MGAHVYENEFYLTLPKTKVTFVGCTRLRRFFVSKGLFDECLNSALSDISKLTVTYTLLYDNVALFDRKIN